MMDDDYDDALKSKIPPHFTVGSAFRSGKAKKGTLTNQTHHQVV